MIREANAAELDELCAVINDGAAAYKGVIPDDRWHEPYMSRAELAAEMAAGVEFSCWEDSGAIVGVMGVQDKGPVMLIRHAYVRTSARRRGIGAALLRALRSKTDKPVLIGTWRAAQWAVDFYVKHGFSVLPDDAAQVLLARSWRVPARQMATSVVLAEERFLASGLHLPPRQAIAGET